MSANKHTTIMPAKRAQALVARRKLKMASSAHAYVRGSTVQFYRWLGGQGKRAVPKGPAIWICGDCHAGNLGPLAAPDGKVHVQASSTSIVASSGRDLRVLDERLQLSRSITVCGFIEGADKKEAR